MGFEALLGNERLKDNLRRSIGRGRISHFYLISGPAGSGKRTLAKLLAAAILCKGSEKPCGTCSACRKVFGSGHPDFITVDDPEKKTVTVGLVRQAREDMYILPNEADHKIYLFPRAQDMGIEGQNALLKVLEEPPGYGVFLLLTDKEDNATLYTYLQNYTKDRGIMPVMGIFAKGRQTYCFSCKTPNDIWDNDQWSREYTEEEIPAEWKTEALVEFKRCVLKILPDIQNILQKLQLTL